MNPRRTESRSASRYSRISAREIDNIGRISRPGPRSAIAAIPAAPAPRIKRISTVSAWSSRWCPSATKSALNLIRNAQQKFAPSVARPLLEVGSRRKPLGALDDQLKTEPRAHRTHKRFVAIRLSSANPMVQMRGRNFVSFNRSRNSTSTDVSATESAPPESPISRDEPGPTPTRKSAASIAPTNLFSASGTIYTRLLLHLAPRERSARVARDG